MLDMLYINDQTKSLISFQLEGKSFLELYAEINNQTIALKEIAKHCEHIIEQFGHTVEIPPNLLEDLKEQDLDELLLNLHQNPKHLFTENFFVLIPLHMMRQCTDMETLRIYNTFGINQYLVLLKSDDDKTVHLAAAELEEFKERFELIEKVSA